MVPKSAPFKTLWKEATTQLQQVKALSQKSYKLLLHNYFQSCTGFSAPCITPCSTRGSGDFDSLFHRLFHTN